MGNLWFRRRGREGRRGRRRMHIRRARPPCCARLGGAHHIARDDYDEHNCAVGDEALVGCETADLWEERHGQVDDGVGRPVFNDLGAQKLHLLCDGGDHSVELGALLALVQFFHVFDETPQCADGINDKDRNPHSVEEVAGGDAHRRGARFLREYRGHDQCGAQDY